MKEVQIVSLGEIMAKKLGSVDPSKYPDEVFDLYSIPAFDSRQPEVVAGKLIGSTKQIVETDDVLLSKIVPHIRRSWVVGETQGRRIIASGEWIVFRSEKIYPNYLRHVLVSDPFHLKFMSTVSGVGGSLLRARPAFVEKIKIPLPPIPEQKRIADILDRAEALRAKRRAALTQLDELTQSIFIDMFGEPVTNPKGWPTVECANACERITVGVVVKPASYYVSSGVPALRSLNIKPGYISLKDLVYFSEHDNNTKLAKTKLKAGDLAIVRTGQPGTSAVVPADLDGVNAIDLLIATPYTNIVNSVFLCQFFNSSGGRSIVLTAQRGQIQKHLNVGSLNESCIPLPPIELQQEFARRVAALKKLKALHKASLTELDELFASLQYRAFRGEL